MAELFYDCRILSTTNEAPSIVRPDAGACERKDPGSTGGNAGLNEQATIARGEPRLRLKRVLGESRRPDGPPAKRLRTKRAQGEPYSRLPGESPDQYRARHREWYLLNGLDKPRTAMEIALDIGVGVLLGGPGVQVGGRGGSGLPRQTGRLPLSESVARPGSGNVLPGQSPTGSQQTLVSTNSKGSTAASGRSGSARTSTPVALAPRVPAADSEPPSVGRAIAAVGEKSAVVVTRSEIMADFAISDYAVQDEDLIYELKSLDSREDGVALMYKGRRYIRMGKRWYRYFYDIQTGKQYVVDANGKSADAIEVAGNERKPWRVKFGASKEPNRLPNWLDREALQNLKDVSGWRSPDAATPLNDLFEADDVAAMRATRHQDGDNAARSWQSQRAENRDALIVRNDPNNASLNARLLDPQRSGAARGDAEALDKALTSMPKPRQPVTLLAGIKTAQSLVKDVAPGDIVSFQAFLPASTTGAETAAPLLRPGAAGQGDKTFLSLLLFRAGSARPLGDLEENITTWIVPRKTLFRVDAVVEHGAVGGRPGTGDTKLALTEIPAEQAQGKTVKILDAGKPLPPS
jgi:hypothetical protein